MDTLQKAGSLGLGSRLKRVSDSLFKEVEEIYRDNGIELSPRVFAVIHSLSMNEGISVTELAAMLRLTHPAIIQLAGELEKKGFVKSNSDSKDKRRTLFQLSKKGYHLLDQIQPIWNAIRDELDARIEDSGCKLLEGLTYLENSLQERPLSYAVASRLQASPNVNKQSPYTIVGWNSKYKRDFENLNVEWLKEFDFEIEPTDKKYFEDPQSTILDKGGAIFFALQSNKVVGTCAILAREDKTYELAKMGVTKSRRNLGIGLALIKFSIEHARARGFKELYLETNSKLKSAIKLYKSCGFVEIESPAHYKRVDLTMKLDL